MIFQFVFIHGLHTISHTADLLTNQFRFHHHGNGNFHVHHSHDVVEFFQEVLVGETDTKDAKEEIQLQFQFKLHLYTSFTFCGNLQEGFDEKLGSATNILQTTILDVLTPPPKS